MREDPRHLLDTPEELAAGDPSGMLGLVEGAAEQWRTAMESAASLSPPVKWRGMRRTVVAGMGGSAIAADIAATYLSRRWPVSVDVVRDYALPAWVDADCLVIACSYSGNTEETLSAWREAGERGLERAVITTGGTLGEEGRMAGVPLLSLPEGYPPRAALPSCIVTMLAMLAGVGPEGDTSPGGGETLGEVERIAGRLESLREVYGGDVEVLRNPAKELALWFSTGWPVIYAPAYPLAPVAMRWRGQLGENSKRVASGHLLPEMNHNEIVGWEVQRQFYPATRVLMMEDREQGERLGVRIGTTAELLQRTGAPVRRLSCEGEGLLLRMMEMVLLGDYTSVYLAAGWGIDPTPVEKIDFIKSRLSEVKE
jgi:glucose/mannose-6-phosphate isomerase